MCREDQAGFQDLGLVGLIELVPLGDILIDDSSDAGKVLTSKDQMLIQVHTKRNIKHPLGVDQIRILNDTAVLNVDTRPHVSIVVDIRLLGNIPEAVAFGNRVLPDLLTGHFGLEPLEQLLNAFDLALSVWQRRSFVAFQLLEERLKGIRGEE